MSEKKIERCKFAFPNIKTKEGKTEVVYYCHNPYCEKESEEIECSDCENCENFKSRYIEYPITVSKIERKSPEYNNSSRVGSLVKIRPCGKEYDNKTYLGVLLGDLPTDNHITHNSETEVLTVSNMTNPGIYVFELKKIIFGYESWWGVIENEDELKDITDEDIDNVWYVQLLKSFNKEKDNNMTIFEFAKSLNRREYGKEITKSEEQKAKELGYVVVFGYSDDNVEFRGAIDDEVGCFDGGRVFERNGQHIDAVWCEGDFSWTYDTNIPHATFEIYDNEEKYCRGIVFQLT